VEESYENALVKKKIRTKEAERLISHYQMVAVNKKLPNMAEYVQSVNEMRKKKVGILHNLHCVKNENELLIKEIEEKKELLSQLKTKRVSVTLEAKSLKTTAAQENDRKKRTVDVLYRNCKDSIHVKICLILWQGLRYLIIRSTL
jgi:hypothetical protein